MKTLTALALLGAAALLPACRSSQGYDADIGSRNALANGGGTNNIPLSIVENAVWIPWKLVMTPIVGAVQGTVGWYEVTGEPISGTLTAPVGTALGLLTGSWNAIGQEPIFVERDDNLFDVLGNPFRTDQETYHYTTPPHAQPRYAHPNAGDVEF